MAENLKELILGIHSNVAGDSNEFTAGHGWLTITNGSSTIHYGLWPDDHPAVQNNGPASDIRVNMEANAEPVASRYYRLNPAASKHFNELIKANVSWRMTHNCSSWASEMVKQLTGEDVDADDSLGFETPRELGKSIRALEAREPTAMWKPKTLKRNPASSMLLGRK